jgi:hypothetical protein|tara:strand:- start:54 stop:587 length:534 start_codon:yes stop_codon:yes gene_type:complete
MVIAEKTKDIVEDVEWYLWKDKRYFLREYTFVKPLLEEAKSIADKLHSKAASKTYDREFKMFLAQLKSLGRRQKWQQFRVRYPKLKKSMMELLQLPMLDKGTKNRIKRMLPQVEIYEKDSLKKTTEQIGPEVKRKKPREINWGQVTDYIIKLKQDIQALAYIIIELEKAIDHGVFRR